MVLFAVFLKEWALGKSALGREDNDFDWNNDSNTAVCIEMFIDKFKIPESTRNNKCIKWGMVVKGRNKEPEKYDV